MSEKTGTCDNCCYFNGHCLNKKTGYIQNFSGLCGGWETNLVPLTAENTPGVQFKKMPTEVMPFTSCWGLLPSTEEQRRADAKWILGHFLTVDALGAYSILTAQEYEQLKKIAEGK